MNPANYNITIGLYSEVLRLSDGGQVALDWAELDGSQQRPVLLVLPGLTGGAQADYVRCLVAAARELGAHCVVFHNRGLGGLPLTVSTHLSHYFYFIPFSSE